MRVVAQPGLPRCQIIVTPETFSVGRDVAFNSGDFYGLVTLSCPEEEFGPLLALGKGMQEAGFAPIIWVWPENAEQTNVLVYLSIPAPSLMQLHAVLASANASDVFAKVRSGCSEVYALLAGRVERTFADLFMAEFERRGAVALALRQASIGDPLAGEPELSLTTDGVIGEEPLFWTKPE